MIFNKIIYPLWKKGIRARARLFTGDPFLTILPSGTDILLHGIKSHDSEIRLTGFLLKTLRPGDVFIDVGAHYGYYTLLAVHIVGPEGHVRAFEAAPDSLALLKANTEGLSQVRVTASAVSDHSGEITFWTFPGPTAEWNTTVAAEDRPGREGVPLRVPCITLDEALTGLDIPEDLMIKVDVEGGEPAVLRGMMNILTRYRVTLAMEYLLAGEPDNPHDRAVDHLHRLGYATFAIRPDGTLDPIANARTYMQRQGLLSDNLVFRRLPGASR
jgi:FkbM family methyltransferase